MDKARQEILEKLKAASSNINRPEETIVNQQIYHPLKGNLVEEFKKSLENVSGNAFIFTSEKELFNSLNQLVESKKLQHIYCAEAQICNNLKKYNIPFIQGDDIPKNIEAGITGCEFLVAHLGTVLVSSAQGGGRKVFVYPPIHIVIAHENQIVDYLSTAYYKILKKYRENLPSLITAITGPSRTADIEKTLILGVHGPKELLVFILKK